MRGLLIIAIAAAVLSADSSAAVRARSASTCQPPVINEVSWKFRIVFDSFFVPLQITIRFDPHGQAGKVTLKGPHVSDRRSFDAGQTSVTDKPYDAWRYEQSERITVTLTTKCGATSLNFNPRSPEAGVVRPTSSPTATVGMPFTGFWAYNVKVRPVNGKYSDDTSSHPSVHHTPGGGDWATDLYAPVGTPVRLHVKSSGKLNFQRVASSTSCAGSIQVEVAVDGKPVGYIYIAHLSKVTRSRSITDGMVLGTVADPAKDGECNPGHHVHIELRNASSSTHACWTDHGYPGVKLAEEAPLGTLGSRNKANRQAC